MESPVIRIIATKEKRKKKFLKKKGIEFREINTDLPDEQFNKIFWGFVETARKKYIISKITSVEDIQSLLKLELDVKTCDAILKELYEKYDIVREGLDDLFARSHILTFNISYVLDSSEDISLMIKLLCSAEEYERLLSGGRALFYCDANNIDISISPMIEKKIQKEKMDTSIIDRIVTLREETLTDLRNQEMIQYWKKANEDETIKKIFSDCEKGLREIVKEMRTEIKKTAKGGNLNGKKS